MIGSTEQNEIVFFVVPTLRLRRDMVLFNVELSATRMHFLLVGQVLDLELD